LKLGSLRHFLLLVLWDLNKMRRRVVFVAMRVAWFAIQVGVFGLAFSYMVQSLKGGSDYYRFYLLGVYTSILFTMTVARAYDIAEEFEEGLVDYMLSLPIDRRVLAVGRAIGGGISSFLFALPMYVVVLLLLGEIQALPVMISVAAALLFALSVSGLVMSVVLSVKSTDATDILFGALDALLIRLSTVFYPAAIISSYAPYFYVALVNPISHAADLMRAIFFFDEFRGLLIADPIAMAIYVVGLAVGLSTVATIIVEKRLEGGGWR